MSIVFSDPGIKHTNDLDARRAKENRRSRIEKAEQNLKNLLSGKFSVIRADRSSGYCLNVLQHRREGNTLIVTLCPNWDTARFEYSWNGKIPRGIADTIELAVKQTTL